MALDLREVSFVVDLDTGKLLLARFVSVRARTEQLAEGLSDADASVQAMPDASPTKWHLAHTTWFFEAFVLREGAAGYAPFDSRYHYLFNSYYEAEGPRLARHLRGLLTRPSLEKVMEYRSCVTEAIRTHFTGLPSHLLELIELGCHHEEQHQELLQTDIVNLFGSNPLLPAWHPEEPGASVSSEPSELRWVAGRCGAVEIGHDGAGFAFDCETPRHTTWLAPHALASRLVTNAEWRAFIDAGGYQNADLWLSDGWAWAKENLIEAPLYWRRGVDGDWSGQFGPRGTSALVGHAPVRHVSYYEADAFARWAGARLPTEAEWETAGSHLHPLTGGFPGPSEPGIPEANAPYAFLQQMYGELWQWTASAYLPYPGFRPAAGAVGEYNGKFMSGQFVLRGGSCATPRGHVRASYRNFFYPHQRWQFTGVRLAKDL
ncbi:ergothioneine biosynthesis protein EgtB [Frateuria sp. STR12]|uniref:ergothioneine biosynthesis protein EgtB n=1 Tax=Frateuria hangzhouensis TaxID=2995589 RepID=UPI002260D985|nr:ergothioneine biosynthesis protein EgtB [Frateuria sp. STR12]MCX7513091.1 ergothioneine biosynthesis protein EgtB [Frateuria sp. STR12]